MNFYRSQVNTQGSRASFNIQTGTTENIENYLTPEYIRRYRSIYLSIYLSICRFCQSKMVLTGYPPGLAFFCILIYCSVSFINTFKHLKDTLCVILWFLYCLGFISIEQILFQILFVIYLSYIYLSIYLSIFLSIYHPGIYRKVQKLAFLNKHKVNFSNKHKVNFSK